MLLRAGFLGSCVGIGRPQGADAGHVGFAAKGKPALGGALVLMFGVLGSALAAQAGAYVYWTNYSNNEGRTIGRADTVGTGVTTNFLSTGSTTAAPYYLTLNGEHVYWTNVNTIGRANLDGTGAD